MLNRLKQLRFGSTVLVDYSYLGQGVPVIANYSIQPGVDEDYDPTGNWRGTSTAYLTKEDGTTMLNQNRAHNVANEITNITRTTGTNWPTPTHDEAGNMKENVPQPLSLGDGFDLKWDAWNRLIEVRETGGSVVATYGYDGAHRRVTKLTGSTTRHYYYSEPVAGVGRERGVGIGSGVEPAVCVGDPPHRRPDPAGPGHDGQRRVERDGLCAPRRDERDGDRQYQRHGAGALRV